MSIGTIGNTYTYVYNTETKKLSTTDGKENDFVKYSINGKKYLTCNIAPALTYSEYKEIADIWRSGKPYAYANNNGFTYPDSVYNRVLKRYEDWLYEPISDEKGSRELLQGKIEEMQENIEAGDVDQEPVVQIGASEFTEKEWDMFLENFDELQEDVREAMKLELEKRLKELEENAEMQKKILEETEEEERIKKALFEDEIEREEFMKSFVLKNNI